MDSFKQKSTKTNIEKDQLSEKLQVLTIETQISKKLSQDEVECEKPSNEAQILPFEQLFLEKEPEYKIYRSEHKNKYLKGLQGCQCSDLKRLINILEKNRIKIRKNYFQKLKKTIIKKECNSIYFQIFLGYFQVQISLLKVHLSAQNFNRQILGCGSFSTIYQIQTENGKRYLIKSQKIKPKDRVKLNSNIDQIITQYIFYKIASVLEVGPSMEKVFGYDIVCYEDRIQFAMELCKTKPSELEVQDFDNISQQLHSNLKVLHKLRIVHRDIKEKNIGWSEEYRKWVFIDFGFTKNIRQSIGQKSVTKFIGTIQYTIPELKELFYFNKAGLVDFYQNDLHGLTKTLSNCKGLRAECEQLEEQRELLNISYIKISLQFQLFCHFYRMKNLIFLGAVGQVNTFIYTYPKSLQVYLYLMINQIDTLGQKGDKQKQNQWRVLFKNFNSCWQEQRSKQEYLPGSNYEKLLIQKIKKYAFYEKKKQCREWQGIILYFEDDLNLKKHITQNWLNKTFMKEVLLLIDQNVSNSSAQANHRLQKVVQIIAQQYIAGSKNKSFFWKFRHTLYELENHFMGKKQQWQGQLQSIKGYYLLIGDSENYQRLENMQKWKEDRQKQVSRQGLLINKFISQFSLSEYPLHKLQHIKSQVQGQLLKVDHSEGKRVKKSLSLSTQSRSLIQQQQQVSSQINTTAQQYEQQESSMEINSIRYQVYFNLIIKIIQVIQSKYISQQDNLVLEQAKEQLLKEEDVILKDKAKGLLQFIDIWKYQFMLKYPNYNIPIPIHKHKHNYFSQQQQLTTLYQMQMQSNVYQNTQSMEQTLINQPFLNHIPNIHNINYYHKKGNRDRAIQMGQDMVQMWKNSIHIYHIQLEGILSNIGQVEQKNNIVNKVVGYFKQYSQYQLSKDSIYDYWSFVKIIGSTVQEKQTHKQEDGQVGVYRQIVGIVEKIVQEYRQQKLQTYSQVYYRLLQIKLTQMRQGKASSLQKLIALYQQYKTNRTYWSMECIKQLFTIITEYYLQFNNKQLYAIILHQYDTHQHSYWIYMHQDTVLCRDQDNIGRIQRIYHTLKSYTQYLTYFNIIVKFNIHLTFISFITNIAHHNCLHILNIIIKEESIKTIQSNYFMSAFVFIIYLKLQEKEIQQRKRQRALILCMVNLDNFPSFFRIRLKNTLILRQNIVRQSQKRRKKVIMSRRGGYAKGKIAKLQYRIDKVMKRKKVPSLIGHYFADKVNKIWAIFNI